MKNRTVSLAFILITCLSPAFAQVYLIMANPTDNVGYRGFPSSVAQLGNDGSVQPVLEIVPAESGTARVLISHDSRKAVFISNDLDGQVFVLDFDQASVVKTCPLPKVNGLLPFQEWLAHPPGAELVLGLHNSTLEAPPNETLLGMNLDPVVPCGSSFAPLEREAYKYVQMQGYAGIGDFGDHDYLSLPVGPDGSIKQIWLNGQQTYFEYRLPPEAFSGMKNPEASTSINNPQFFAVSIFDLRATAPPPDGSSRTFVFRKSDQTWHRMPESISIRGLGRFLAMAEVRPKIADFKKETPGASEWKNAEKGNGPGVIGRMVNLKHVYTGMLRLYDVSNGKTYTINTNQGDSEILLVENDVVYYRVYNRLYSAPIAGDSLGQAQLLATSDLIPDAHWAFVKH